MSKRGGAYNSKYKTDEERAEAKRETARRYYQNKKERALGPVEPIKYKEIIKPNGDREIIYTNRAMIQRNLELKKAKLAIQPSTIPKPKVKPDKTKSGDMRKPKDSAKDAVINKDRYGNRILSFPLYSEISDMPVWAQIAQYWLEYLDTLSPQEFRQERSRHLYLQPQTPDGEAKFIISYRSAEAGMPPPGYDDLITESDTEETEDDTEDESKSTESYEESDESEEYDQHQMEYTQKKGGLIMSSGKVRDPKYSNHSPGEYNNFQ